MKCFRNWISYVGRHIKADYSTRDKIIKSFYEDFFFKRDAIIHISILQYVLLVALDHCRTEYVFSLFLGSRYMLFWIAVSIVRIIVVFMLNPIDLGRYISFRLWKLSSLPV